MFYLIEFLFFAIPLAAIAFFIVSLVLYCSARKQNKRQPGSVSAETMKLRKVLLIVSSVIVGVLLSMLIGLCALLYMAVAFM
ncbi:MAG: hypothetical protein IKA63_03400 [Clostridia bacterium]|nr:hypothetical protein [Clostridia bacterium]